MKAVALIGTPFLVGSSEDANNVGLRETRATCAELTCQVSKAVIIRVLIHERPTQNETGS
jgi:hypothetical protein